MPTSLPPKMHLCGTKILRWRAADVGRWVAEVGWPIEQTVVVAFAPHPLEKSENRLAERGVKTKSKLQCMNCMNAIHRAKK